MPWAGTRLHAGQPCCPQNTACFLRHSAPGWTHSVPKQEITSAGEGEPLPGSSCRVPLPGTVLVTGDSVPGGTAAPICCPDNLSGELCCLLAAHVRDVKETPLHLIKQKDHHPLVIQVGPWEAATRKGQDIRKGLCIPWKDAKGIGSARSVLLCLSDWQLGPRRKEENRRGRLLDDYWDGVRIEVL